MDIQYPCGFHCGITVDLSVGAFPARVYLVRRQHSSILTFESGLRALCLETPAPLKIIGFLKMMPFDEIL